MLLVPALLAFAPGLAHALAAPLAGAWDEPAAPALLTATLIVQTIVFLLARTALSHRPLRLALTPRATKARRVRARAMALFAASAEQRTLARTGVLLYLSLDEHRAEIVADAAIHRLVSPDTWGEAMAALLPPLREGKPGAGMAAAVARIGAVLAEHFPKTDSDVNELPDRLIEL
ncbi:MAG: hypothetical protein EOP68_25670 [Sphingomonas sp.]|nr:MAG: hypothetical protein EOP68_25670 [Sphingomonas sp.]